MFWGGRGKKRRRGRRIEIFSGMGRGWPMARMYGGLKGFEDEKWVDSVSRRVQGEGM